MHALLRRCREVLEDRSSTAAMRNAAGAALMTAMDDDIPLPAEYVRAAWRWLRTTSTCSSAYWNTDGMAEVPDEVVRVEALGIMRDPHTGTEERHLALRVLGGRGHAQHLDDHTVLDLVERARTGRQAQDLEGLLANVNTARGIPQEVLRCIRDRWTAFPSVGVREAAIKVGTELLAPDLSWVERVLCDPDADVRASMANAFCEPVEGLLALLQERLQVETAPDVRAALHRGIADQEQVESDRQRRRRRRREAAEEASQDGAEGTDPK
jgi:hypothetical protein